MNLNSLELSQASFSFYGSVLKFLAAEFWKCQWKIGPGVLWSAGMDPGGGLRLQPWDLKTGYFVGLVVYLVLGLGLERLGQSHSGIYKYCAKLVA